MTKRLLLLSESISKRIDPEEPIPAFDRYTGVFYKVVKKLIREKKVKNIDIIILSQSFGVFKSSTKIPYYELETPIKNGFGHKLTLTGSKLEEARINNLKTLNKHLSSDKYSEIIVCLGKSYQQLVAGIEEQTKTPIKYVEGKGLGPKARNLALLLTEEITKI